MESYGVEPQNYLARAKDRLKEATNEGLFFYAALELRSYLEARQDAYLDAQRRYVKSIPRAWETSKQGRSLHKVFDSGKIQRLFFKFADAQTLEAYYLPVTEALRKGAEKLSDLVHAQSEYRPPEDQWWESTRQRVLAVYRLAWVCQKGTLLCPALLDKGTVVGALAIEFGPGEFNPYRDHFKAGGLMRVQVSYPDAPPEGWVPDL